MNPFSIGTSLFNPINLASIAMGPAGWANLAMRTIGSQIAMNAIQQVGQRLGMPQYAIEFAQASFANSIGARGLARQNIGDAVRELGNQFNLSPRDQAGLQRAAEFDLREFQRGIEEAVQRGKSQARRGRGKGSILEIIADAMIRAMNSKVGEMQRLAEKMDNVKHKKGQSDSVQINTDLTVATQEFSMMMNATSNMIKTIGESLSAMARKN